MNITILAVILKTRRVEIGKSIYRIQLETGLHFETIRAIETGSGGYSINSMLSYLDAVGMEIKLQKIDL